MIFIAWYLVVAFIFTVACCLVFKGRGRDD
jgi:uncharacterized membrane protein YjjB (DUF3815 family)